MNFFDEKMKKIIGTKYNRADILSNNIIITIINKTNDN